MKFVKINFVAFAVAGTLLLASCGSGENETNTTDSSTMVEDISAAADSAGDALRGNPDQNFIKDIVELNTKEIAWLKAGMSMGTDKDVKAHSKMMLADHEKMATEVTAYAASKSLEVPNVDTAGEVDINEKKGADWDKKWADKMVEDHEKVINRFEDAEDDVKDAELKAMISKTLPTLRSHLEMAKTVKEKFNK